MPSRRLPPPAIQIANILLDLDWIERHRRYGWLRTGNSNRDLAAEIAAVMSPDLLLAGASRGAKPERVIPLNDVPRPPMFARAVRLVTVRLVLAAGALRL